MIGAPCKNVFIVLIIVFFIFSIKSQDVPLFKEKIPIEQYEQLLERETKAQNTEDAFERASLYNSLATEVTKSSDSLGTLLYKRAMKAAELAQNDSMIARVWMRGSIPYINTGQYDKAAQRLEVAFKYWNRSNDSINLADCYILQGYLERLKGRHYLALDNLQKAKSIQAELLEPYEMWNIANRTMLNYGDLGDYPSAIRVGEEYLSQADVDKEYGGYYLVLRNTGNYLFYNKDFQKARAYIEESLPLFMVGRYPKHLSHSYSLLRDIAMEEGDFELADEYADSTVFYSNQFDSPRLQCEAHVAKFRILKKIGKHDRISYHVSKAYDAALLSNHKQSLLGAAEALAEFEASKSRYASGYEYLAIADSLRQELFSEDLANKLDELEKRLLLEKSQEEIDMLNEQNNLKAENLEKASQIRNYLIGFLALALGACVLAFLLMRQRSKYNEVLKAKNAAISKSLSEKELLLREIHHRVKNNLQFISSLLRLQSDHVTDPTALGALQQGHDRVRSMALIHQDLYKEDNLTGVDARSYFRKLITGLFKSNNIHDDRIDLKLEVGDLNLDVDTIVPIGLITNELVTNSLKYAFPNQRKGEISVSLFEQEGRLSLNISDNGVGLDDSAQNRLGESFGYKLIKALVDQMKGALEILRENGTAVRITLKKYEKV